MTPEFTSLPDLASRDFGSGIVYANDEFFAAADHLIAPARPVFTPHTSWPRDLIASRVLPA